MTSRIYRTAFAAAAALGLVAVGAAASAAPSRPADPHSSCGGGIYAGYTGTQEDGNGQSVAVENGQLTAVSGRSGRYADECFFWFAYDGGQNKIAEFAPGGVASNEVLAAVRGGFGRRSGGGYTVGLQAADGSAYQQWNYNTADNGTWTNEGTGQVLAVGRNGQLELATAPVTVPPDEDWTFVPAS